MSSFACRCPMCHTFTMRLTLGTVLCALLVVGCSSPTTTPASGSAATSLGTSGATTTLANAVTTAPPSTLSTGSAYGGDPCAVIDIATLTSLTGLSGLTAKPSGTGGLNGCSWLAGSNGVAYDVVHQLFPTDRMSAIMKNSANGAGSDATITDLGGGQSIVIIPGFGGGGASIALLLGDRQVDINVTLNGDKDPAPLFLPIAKAFNAVAGALPPPPKR